MKSTQILTALALAGSTFLAINVKAAANPGPSLSAVQAQLKKDLADPQHPVNKWQRMIKETVQDGRWAGISKDYEVIRAGHEEEFDRGNTSYQGRYLVIFIESNGFHHGAESYPLVFSFTAIKEPAIKLRDFKFVSLRDGTLLRRHGFGPEVLPTTSDKLSDDTRAQLAKEVILAAGMDETVQNFNGDGGASPSFAVDSIETNSVKAGADLTASCSPKAGTTNISTCQWGWKKASKSEALQFDMVDDRQDSGGRQGSKRGEAVPGTLVVVRK